jgi:hypothetical protein
MYKDDVEGELAELEASTASTLTTPTPATNSAHHPGQELLGATVSVNAAVTSGSPVAILATTATAARIVTSGLLSPPLHSYDDSPPLFSEPTEQNVGATPVPLLSESADGNALQPTPMEGMEGMEGMESVTSGLLFEEGSLSGMDFGEISGEAERLSEMLATPAPAKQRAIDFNMVTSAADPVPVSESRPEHAGGTDVLSSCSAAAETVSHVQGTLDFASSNEEDSSDEEEHNAHMQQNMLRRGQPQAVLATADFDDSSSGELEIFRPPPPPHHTGAVEQGEPPLAEILSHSDALNHGRGQGSFQRSQALGLYRLLITTGSRPGAGTEHDVHLTLMGLLGSSQHLIRRDAGQAGVRFGKGQMDEVQVDAEAELGDIGGIQVGD